MRRAGANPTDIEVMEIMNKIDDESGFFDFPVSIDKPFWGFVFIFTWNLEEFCYLMTSAVREDAELELKETFRVFSKDSSGCVPAEEIKSILFKNNYKII